MNIFNLLKNFRCLVFNSLYINFMLLGCNYIVSYILRKYDVISGYCNTNNDQVYPTYHQCDRGYASGPLTLIRNNNATYSLLHLALTKWWRKYFRAPRKFFIDEDYSPWKHNKYRTLHTILRDHDLEHDFRQYCDDSCKATNSSDEMFIVTVHS